MTRIVGYTDRAVVRPGEVISGHVSLVSKDPSVQASYAVKLVRVVGIDAAGDSERTEHVPSAVDGQRIATVSETANGSYADVSLGKDAQLDRDGTGLTLQSTVMATLATGADQALISLRAAGAATPSELTLMLDGQLRPTLVVGAVGSIESRRVTLDAPLDLNGWYRIAGGYGPGGAFLELTTLENAGLGAASPSVRASWTLAQAPELTSATVRIGARAAEAADASSQVADPFTGRLEHPMITTGRRDAAARASLADPCLACVGLSADMIALWDLGRGVDGWEIHDISGHGRHGRLHGLPMRAVTGSNWDGETTSIREAPEQYRALHFFADATEDAGWPQAFALEIPSDLRSGVYAFVLECGGDVDTVPFVVGAADGSEANLLLLIPTATYLAYSNARFTWERVNWEIQREATLELGRSEELLIAHPEFGISSYDQYRDGTNATYVSWRRPNLDMRAGQQRHENYRSDLYLIDWLERNGYAYDVSTDDALDREAGTLLAPYRAVLTGTHPEYSSTRASEALAAFVNAGGRLAVLGGNAFHFLVAFSSDRPWIMEVRKDMNVRPGTRAAAEGHMGFTGENSAEFDAPRPAERLLGTSTASMGFDLPRPYERDLASEDPRFAWVFDGVSDAIIGIGGVLGGAVFQEWDSTLGVADLGAAQPRPAVLATSSGHSVATRWFGAEKEPNHAEMTLSTTPAGGAIFSAASMTWCLCLEIESVSTITANVVGRFLDPAPFPE